MEPAAPLKEARNFSPQAYLAKVGRERRLLERNIVALGSTDVSEAWRVWDAILAALIAGGAEATKSVIGDTYVGGEPQHRSRRTYDMAINGPVGALTQAALALIDSQKLARRGITADIRDRLAAARGAPAEGSDNAVSVLLKYLIYFDRVDEKYAAEVLAPLLDCNQPTAEPAWSGYLAGRHIARPELFLQIRGAFLESFRQSLGWRWSEPRGHLLAEFLVAMLLDTRARHYLSPQQARGALQEGGEPACLGALHALARRMSDHVTWLKIKQLVLSVWPNEARLQTRATSQVFVDITMRTGDDFPDAVQVCLPYIKPIGDLGFVPFRLIKADGVKAGFAQRFPRHALRLLDATVGTSLARPPYQLREALDAIAEADSGVQQDPVWRRLLDIADLR